MLLLMSLLLLLLLMLLLLMLSFIFFSFKADFEFFLSFFFVSPVEPNRPKRLITIHYLEFVSELEIKPVTFFVVSLLADLWLMLVFLLGSALLTLL